MSVLSLLRWGHMMVSLSSYDLWHCQAQHDLNCSRRSWRKLHSSWWAITFRLFMLVHLKGSSRKSTRRKETITARMLPCSCNPSELLRLVPLMIVLLLTSVKLRAKVAWTHMGIQGCSQETFNQGPCDLLTSHNIPGASTVYGIWRICNVMIMRIGYIGNYHAVDVSYYLIYIDTRHASCSPNNESERIQFCPSARWKHSPTFSNAMMNLSNNNVTLYVEQIPPASVLGMLFG